MLDACVQLHGGYGFMNEYRVARVWRDARSPRSGPAPTKS
ncbi:acyl-CoA dehydrogenase family protein [Streptomyces xantholiticus]